MKANKRAIRLTVRAGAVAVCVLAASFLAAAAGRAANPTYTVCIDIPFHPLFDYLAEKSDTIFAGKPYTVKFKVLDAKTQVPAFGAGQCNVMTTPPSFIPRVTDQYHLNVAEFFPLARWTIGPQILVKKGSPYTTLESLKGKKVAITPLNTRFGSEEAAIEAATTYPLLSSGKFKAIYSVHDAFLKAFGDPAVVNGGYIARTDFIKNTPGFIHDLVKATQNVWNQYAKSPKSVNDVASEQSGIPAAQLAVVGQVLDLDKMPVKLRAITPQDVKTWSKLFPLLQKSGFIKTVPKNPTALFVVTK